MSKNRNEEEVYSRNVGFNLRVAYTAEGRQEYIGMAYPKASGTTDSEAIWSIYKLTYDSSGRNTHRYYADGTDAFTKVWDSRASYTYA